MLTITKLIALSCVVGMGTIVGLGTNGIVIAAATTDVVHIKGLDIEGGGTGVAGIRVISVGALVVEDTVIRGFNSANGLGGKFAPSNAATFR